MSPAAKRYLPPVGFFFALNLQDDDSRVRDTIDAGFQEVSGLGAKMAVTTIQEGGENRFAHKAPGRVTYDDLVLRRGLVVWSSPLGQWCRNHLSGGLLTKVTPKDVTLLLLNGPDHDPIMAWHFVNAFPVAWQVSDFKAQDSAIVVETLTLTYSYFWVNDELGGAYLKK